MAQTEYFSLNKRLFFNKEYFVEHDIKEKPKGIYSNKLNYSQRHRIHFPQITKQQVHVDQSVKI